MAILKALDSQNIIYVKPTHIFGRDPSVADTVLNCDSCSRMHCVIRWQNGLWFLTDESRNGCYVNGERIEKGKSFSLTTGDTLAIGKDKGVQWVLENDNAPKPVLICENHQLIELSSLNILPNESSPECQILKNGEEWVYESGHDYQAIDENFRCHIGGKEWTFYPNRLVQETKFYDRVNEENPKLSFNVSRNEEHVQITFELDGKSFDLGHKTHHYLLLEMARHQQQDNTQDSKDLGWMSNDLLLNNMRIDINHLNIQIYRAREAIRKCSSHWGQHLIERRRGEIRLHPCEVVIHEAN